MTLSNSLMLFVSMSLCFSIPFFLMLVLYPWLFNRSPKTKVIKPKKRATRLCSIHLIRHFEFKTKGMVVLAEKAKCDECLNKRSRGKRYER